MSKKEEEEESVYENTNGMPMAGGRNLHMEVLIFSIFSIYSLFLKVYI